MGRHASWRACLRLRASRPVLRFCQFVLETWQVLQADRWGCMRLGPPALCPVLPAGRLVSDLGYQTRVQYCQRAGFTSSLGHEACILWCLRAPCKACIQCCRLAWALEVYPVLPAGRFGCCRVPVSRAASGQVAVPPGTCYRQADLPEIWAGAAYGSAGLPSEWGCVLCSQWAGWRTARQLYPVLPAGRLT